MTDFEARVRALEGDVASVMGVLNAAHGRLAVLVADAVEGDLWNGWGIHSPSHWVAWQAGVSPAHAQGLVGFASRRAELPTAFAALVAGELTLDAAIEIGRRAPSGYEASITEFARVATISQLRRCLKRYHYDDETERARPKPVADDRCIATGTDEKGWWINGRLPADEGAVVDQALAAAREDRWDQERADTPEGEKPQPVSTADALVGAAESYLRHGEAAHPGSDRYQVFLHLEAAPDGGPATLSLHQGPVLPPALRRLLLCDCTVAPVWERHGTPISVGRKLRQVSRRVRRILEHRDGGCRVPGCGRTHGLDIHHIVHWEDGGGTDSDNLACLCARHHRLHHLGQLGIDGNADTPGGLVFTDPWGRVLDPSGTPVRPVPGNPPEQARSIGIEPGRFVHPLGERLDPWAVTFNPNPPPDEPTRPEPQPGPTAGGTTAGPGPDADHHGTPPGQDSPPSPGTDPPAS